MSVEKILIINYTFPPSRGIGGRRWAKFAKNLKRAGADVHVICAEPEPNESSPWDSDVEGIKTYFLKENYPHLEPVPKTIFQRFRNHVVFNFLKVASKGTPYDRALFWKKPLLKKASQIITEQGITKLIVSGAPFRLLWIGTFIKKRFPEIFYLADLRDPWTWEDVYGIEKLSKRKRDFEHEMLTKVISEANMITVPVIPMVENLIALFPAHKEKINLIPHGFDPDEVQVNPPKKVGKKLKLFYFGSLYKVDEHFRALISTIKAFPDQIELNIYTRRNKYEDWFLKENLSSQVKYFKPIPAKELFIKLKEADFILLFKMAERGKDNISTKYYEIIHSRIPILLIGTPGAASELVVKNKLGIHFQVDEVEKGFENLLNGRNRLDFNYNFDTSEFSFPKITEHLLQKMNAISEGKFSTHSVEATK